MNFVWAKYNYFNIILNKVLMKTNVLAPLSAISFMPGFGIKDIADSGNKLLNYDIFIGLCHGCQS